MIEQLNELLCSDLFVKLFNIVDKKTTGFGTGIISSQTLLFCYCLTFEK